MKLQELQQNIDQRDESAAKTVREDLAFQIGLEVEVARAKKGMTQQELAERLGTKQPSIARIESGAALPSVRTLERIARALDLDLQIGFSPLHNGRVSDAASAKWQRVSRTPNECSV